MSQEVAVELFRHIDKDGSGFITYTELSKALANVRLPKPVPKEYADSEDMTELTGEELEAAERIFKDSNEEDCNSTTTTDADDQLALATYIY